MVFVSFPVNIQCICFKQHFDTRYLVFYNPSPPRMFLSLDLLSEYRIQHGAIRPLHVTSNYSTWIFCRGASGFATDCPCDVWCHGLTTCPQHAGPPFGNRFLNTSWAVGLTYWIEYLLFFWYFDICNDIFEGKMLSFGNRCLLTCVLQVFADYHKYQELNRIIHFKRYQAASFRNTHGLVSGRNVSKSIILVNILTKRCISYLPVYDLTILCNPAVSPQGPPGRQMICHARLPARWAYASLLTFLKMLRSIAGGYGLLWIISVYYLPLLLLLP